MDFDFTDDQLDIKRAARDALARHSSLETVRAAAERGTYHAGLVAQHSELGWPGIAIPEAYGGSGLGLVDLVVLLEECGYALTSSPLLSSVSAALVLNAAGSAGQQAQWLPKLADGAATGALGLIGHPTDRLVSDVVNADVIVLVEDGKARLLASDEAVTTPVEAIDLTRRYGTVSGDGEMLPGDPTGGVDAARVAVSAETIGVCQRALEITTAYVKDREQFGRPIGSFQAVQQMLVEMLMQTEAARSGVYWAAWSVDAQAENAHEAALIAKAGASAAARSVTSLAIQAHGGIGFTWEANLHWLFRRAQLNARALGGTPEVRWELARLLRAREPALA